jgi:hypothetical protein
MALHSSSYQHWEGRRQGVMARRAVIIGNGITECFQSRWLKYLAVSSWGVGFIEVVILFFLGQLLVTDSLISQWIQYMNPQAKAFIGIFIIWLENTPEISVRVSYNILFYYFIFFTSFVPVIAITMVLPNLITRDLGSNAIIIYSSKAVSRLDYIIGKFGTVFGVLTIVWLGPTLMAWVFGNMMSPHWHFFWHSRIPLMNVASYLLISMVFYSFVSLGVSAISPKEKLPVFIWLMVLWFFASQLSKVGTEIDRDWLRYCSFAFNLHELAKVMFNLSEDMELIRSNVPFIGGFLDTAPDFFNPARLSGQLREVITSLSIMVGLSLAVLFKRVKPE